MQFVADLHLHSKYSRAVSQNMTLPVMAEFARKKGIDILSTGDWTHPLWIREIRLQLEEAGEGLYKLRTQNVKHKTNSKVEDDEREPMFLLATEIASIYSQAGKLRRIHNLVLSPNIETAGKINRELSKRGCNLHSDGRPIIGLSSKALLELVLSIDAKTMLIPCHIWTPHFGIYGVASGFDSLKEACGEMSKYIYGIETGLSSDPLMNWKIKELDNRSILSFSDAHSPAKMGREATVFVFNKNGMQNAKCLLRQRCEASKIQNKDRSSQDDTVEFRISYDDIVAAIKRDKSAKLKIGYTIEFYPEEGKYHFSGHRNCKVVYGPDDLRIKGNICPVCRRKLTDGVLNRVLELANKSEGEVSNMKMSGSGVKWYLDKQKIHPPFVKIVPLLEIIAETIDSTVFSQKVKAIYDSLCSSLGSEFNVLLLSSIDRIERYSDDRIAQAVKKVREGQIVVDPGYDGEYGKVKIFAENAESENRDVKSKENVQSQLGLGL